MKELKRIELPGGHGSMWIEESDEGIVTVHRHASRGNVKNVIGNYDLITAEGKSLLTPLTKEVAFKALQKVESGIPYSSAFIVADASVITSPVDMVKTDSEHLWTSTGRKFWRHSEQMFSYKTNGGKSIVSTHISPEGACNLKCPYCSVTYRDTHSRINPDVIRKYVTDLVSRGLKAIIFTGGGEPTIYPHFNEIVQWAKWDLGLSVALITNGTQAKRVEDRTWEAFSWVRVSLNVFDGWEEKIFIPTEKLSDDCIVGTSMVYTSEHQATKEHIANRLDLLKKASRIVDRINGTYCRVLPNCMLEQKMLLLQHRALDHDLADLGDPRFFHQHKEHETPESHVCHQAFFRPYLSEEKFKGNGQPGTVYPCDSVVLTDSYQHFAEKYQICHASDVLKFLDGNIKQRFDPTQSCGGCVFKENVDMLGAWKDGKIDRFSEFKEKLTHEEFV